MSQRTNLEKNLKKNFLSKKNVFYVIFIEKGLDFTLEISMKIRLVDFVWSVGNRQTCQKNFFFQKMKS